MPRFWKARMQLLRATFLAILLSLGPAHAEITLTPLRQVLTPKDPVATYRVSNPSGRIIEGRVSWIDLAATETGYERATEAQRRELSAAPFLTLWPAYFRLEPGASATIRVAIKDPKRNIPGERRSHLLVETSAVRTPLRQAGGGIELDIGLGVSTPVILRPASGKATARFGETRLLRTPDGFLELQTHVEATGATSAYGRVDVLFHPYDTPGKEKLLKRIDNVAAYIDTRTRRVAIPLDVEYLAPGVLDLRYVGRSEYEGTEFAARSFEIAPPG